MGVTANLRNAFAVKNTGPMAKKEKKNSLRKVLYGEGGGGWMGGGVTAISTFAVKK